ncbi:membrane-spanning 4-domains subfamily A member 12-like [Clarias gariepinus]|uniref:membrane-spanning 4-domains subfamily A member 12-like n=1 Tax=Clarias gariepinus TaxID=13013 RepID=UPI00234CC0F3|nr:membrane-spanning 4-domains subfamily A member 12-like [Clarias gariepinus]
MLPCCLNADQKILGIVQAITGAVMFMFGFANRNSHSVSDSSGVIYWGSISFISSGILSAVPGGRWQSCLKKVSMIMNLISTGGGIAATGLFSADLYNVVQDPKLLNELKKLSIRDFNPFQNGSGNSGALLVFSLLEVCMSIWTFIRIWKSK